MGERRSAERAARRLFGRALRPWEYAGLSGAPDDARVELGTWRSRLSLETVDPLDNGYRAYHSVGRTERGLVLINDGFAILIESMRRRGLALRMLLRQVAQAAALGVRAIRAIAGRRADECGYYTWPRYGFDGPLPRGIREQLPPGLAAARCVLDLMESEQGRRWWRDNGRTIRVVFDLTRHSRSWKVLVQYACMRGIAGDARREK